MTNEANAAITGALDAGATVFWSTTAIGSCETFWPKSFILQPRC